MPFNNRSRSPPYPSHFLSYFTMLSYIFGTDCQTTLPKREAYKSLACRNLCTITLLLLCPDTRSSAKVLTSR